MTPDHPHPTMQHDNASSFTASTSTSTGNASTNTNGTNTPASSSAGARACFTCTAGKYTGGGGFLCNDCAHNTYALAVGSSTCLSCPQGTFQPFTGQSSCMPCVNLSVVVSAQASVGAKRSALRWGEVRRGQRAQGLGGNVWTGIGAVRRQDDSNYCQRATDEVVERGVEPLPAVGTFPPANIGSLPVWLSVVAGVLFGIVILAAGCWCARRWRRQKTGLSPQSIPFSSTRTHVSFTSPPDECQNPRSSVARGGSKAA